MLASLAWRGNLHQSAVQSLLMDEIAATTSAISLLSASSNGLLVETRLHQAVQVQELHHSVIFDGGRMNPVFCLLAARDLVFAGMAKNEVRAWRKSDWSPVDVDMKGHTGWVRGIAVRKNLLFTAACNFVKVWELRGTFHTDRDDDDDEASGTIMDVSYVGDIKLFKGDILALAVSSDHLYCGTADGFLHSWKLPAQEEQPKLRPSSFTNPRTVRAHDGRITSLLVHEGTLFSAGKDGYVRSWSTDNLREISRFAAGQKLRALVAGSGRLFFAGDEALGSTSPSLSLNGLQTLHRASTKSLAGNMELLASGGADGEVRLWSINSR